MPLWSCVGVWSDFQFLPIDSHRVRFRVAYANAIRSGGTPVIHVYSRYASIFNHEANARMFGRIYVKACLLVLFCWQRKVLVENRIQLRQAHIDFHRANPVKTDYPRLPGKNTDADDS